MTDKIIMYDSPEAATYKTGIEGWVSRDGHFYGKDEHMARWAGCTHMPCEKCGAIKERNFWCNPCREKRKAEEFTKLPVEKWDGTTPVCVFDSDTYFFDEGELLDFLADIPEDQEVHLCKCEPIHLRIIDSDYWCDDLPDEGELPPEVEEAMEALNKAISAAGPVAWEEGSIAIDVADLRSRMENEQGETVHE